MQPSERNRQLNEDRYDSLSIPRYAIKKNQSRGPRHGQSMRRIIYHKARDTLRKAKHPKNGSCETILERFPQMQSIKSQCLVKVGQKRTSDSTTHLPRITIPMKLHLQRGDDGKGSGNLF